MSRQQQIRVSEDEKAQLDRVRDDLYGHEAVPYGAVIQKLVNIYYSEGDH